MAFMLEVAHLGANFFAVDCNRSTALIIASYQIQRKASLNLPLGHQWPFHSVLSNPGVQWSYPVESPGSGALYAPGVPRRPPKL